MTNETNPDNDQTTTTEGADRHIKQVIQGGYDDIKIYKQRRKAVYYSLTETEIESYADLGWMATFSLTFFGIGSGFCGGCIVALIQSPPPTLTSSTLFWMSCVSGFFSLVLFLFFIMSLHFQRKQKQLWKPEKIEE